MLEALIRYSIHKLFLRVYMNRKFPFLSLLGKKIRAYNFCHSHDVLLPHLSKPELWGWWALTKSRTVLKAHDDIKIFSLYTKQDVLKLEMVSIFLFLKHKGNHFKFYKQMHSAAYLISIFHYCDPTCWGTVSIT